MPPGAGWAVLLVPELGSPEVALVVPEAESVPVVPPVVPLAVGLAVGAAQQVVLARSGHYRQGRYSLPVESLPGVMPVLPGDCAAVLVDGSSETFDL